MRVLFLTAALLLLTVPAVARAEPPELPAIPVGAYGWPVAGLSAGAPVAGGVARRFLAPPTPYGRGHRGVDLAAAPGTPVVAAGPGTVVYAGLLAGRGVVSVQHAGGLRTTYEPVAASVVVGASVARGTVVGTLDPGHPGCPASACLHWGLRWAHPPGAPREQYLDPLLLVGLGRTRLWPAG
ncbi:murein hydrolase activator EnvC family protein [Actinomycetospora termitidis]|uniref:Peptidoglycan DD-metalloendopeptidase family protein n=1 Tax=Actinomycetospora termitidis TaxID=3053470 RepID=A0ABT7M5P5_9PSEU|nr:M23 family metallopeptidase [Actinomycetospora sp. Odt1-22]MDL5155985.1 peptidoglycan DD-metalloendopeptidase family protein [Actinomycetospora sp. Odt1-22]